MNDKPSVGVTIALYIFAALGGFAAIVAPPYIVQGGINPTQPTPLFPWLWMALEDFQLIPTLVSFVCLGAILGVIRPHQWLWLGMATMAVFPVAAFLEMIVDSKSHNLWPIEFVVYGVYSLPATIAALVASRIKLRQESKRTLVT